MHVYVLVYIQRPATEGVFPRANNPWESRPLFKAQEGIGLGTSDENPTRWGWAASSAGVESGEFNLMEDVHPAQLLFEGVVMYFACVHFLMIKSKKKKN